jgi:UDP-glucose:(glucosyl)LPS alpha-1,2-glucosyltransferase
MADVRQVSPARGGTELILANLKQALPDLCEKVQIICSRPQQTPLDPVKPRILWLQDLPQDPASACLADATYRTNFNKIVFVSHWQQQMYNMQLRIPFHDGIVIKNAVPRLMPTFPKPRFTLPAGFGKPNFPEDPILAELDSKEQTGRLRFLYTSTPHRGLAILAAAADALVKERQDWELHIYSSLKTYGWDEADKQFDGLYETLQKNPCVVYHGSGTNAEVRQACLDAHIWVYPSIYAETSCMSAQEAMMAGCLAITTNFGALPETCAEWAWMFPIDEQAEIICQRTHLSMRSALDLYDDPNTQSVLRAQSDYFQKFWAFEGRINAWRGLLEQVIADGPRKEMLTIE